MKITPYMLRAFAKITPFVLFWLTGSILYSVVEKGLLGDADAYPSTGNPYEFYPALIVGAIVSVLAGLSMGAVEVFYLSRIFARASFTVKIFGKSALYVLSIVVFLLMVSYVANSYKLGLPVFHPEVTSNIVDFVTNFAFLSIIIYAGAIMTVAVFISEVSDNMGLEVFKNFLLGKYNRPREEERIFMFVDMKSSTTIAEKLGHVEYFELLKSYYADLNDATVHTWGEIKEYVGDQMTVSWTIKKGLDDLNCIQCFFRMKRTLEERQQFYMDHFGLCPDFKAGLHCGQVTTGEIGVFKKDIIFTGDVMNTTARIQAKCNEYKVDILLSESLVSRLKLEPAYRPTELGEVELKGKDQRVRIFTLESTASDEQGY